MDLKPAIFCATLSLAVNLLPGQAGTLDPSFDDDGIVTTVLGPSSDVANAVAVQSDQKIVVAGHSQIGLFADLAVVRYTPDGVLDSTFSQDGIVIAPLSAYDDFGRSVAIQADQKIVVAGHGSGIGIALVRYDPDGTLDTTFSSDGIVTADPGTAGAEAAAVCIQADGKIVAAGSAWNASSSDFLAVRYNTDGTLDNSFGTDGVVMTDAGGGERGSCMALQSDGKILIAGWGDDGFMAMRYMTDGSLDGTFDLDGIVTTDFGSGSEGGFGIAMQDDGKIVVAGSALIGPTWDIAVLRYQTDGSLDNSFDGDGKLTTAVNEDDAAWGIAVQVDGKIVVTGNTRPSLPAPASADMLVLRYLPNGALDSTFSGDGLVVTDIGSGTNEGHGIALQADGKILQCGMTSSPDGDFLVLRYLSDLSVGLLEFSAISSAALIYPNPLGDEAVLDYELATDEELTSELFDVEGRRTHTFFSTVHRAAGPHRETLDLSGLAAGPYTLVLSNGKGKTSVRVVKQ